MTNNQENIQYICKGESCSAYHGFCGASGGNHNIKPGDSCLNPEFAYEPTMPSSTGGINRLAIEVESRKLARTAPGTPWPR